MGGTGEADTRAQLCRLLTLTIAHNFKFCAHPAPILVLSNQKQTKATRGEISGLFCLSPLRWRYKCCFGFHNLRGLCLQSKIHPTKSGNWKMEPLQWELGHWRWTRESRGWGCRGGQTEKSHFIDLWHIAPFLRFLPSLLSWPSEQKVQRSASERG